VLRGALTSLLNTDARFGLVRFPIDAVCGAPTAWTLPVPSSDVTADLQAQSSNVATAIGAFIFQGGTPTGPALQLVGAMPPPPEAGREQFALLVTDGAPNCNANNPNGQCAGTNPACQCTTTSCAGSLCSLGCLDTMGAATAAMALATANIKTMVVGLGADVATSSAALDAIAAAGGAPAQCPGLSSTECGANATCTAGACSRPWYSVLSLADGTQAMALINKRLRTSGQCRFVLSRAVATGRLQVSIGGVPVTGGFTHAGDRVTLGATACDQALAGQAVSFSAL
jgi:hypothetical protein